MGFEEYVEMLLEDEDLETVLERYNVTPMEALMKLYDTGMIDEPSLSNFESDANNEEEQGYQ